MEVEQRSEAGALDGEESRRLPVRQLIGVDDDVPAAADLGQRLADVQGGDAVAAADLQRHLRPDFPNEALQRDALGD